MLIDLKELNPTTRQERYMYALCERLEALIPKVEEATITVTKVEDKPVKATRKKSKV